MTYVDDENGDVNDVCICITKLNMAEMNFVTKLVSIIEMVELADVANAFSSILYL